MATVCLPTAVVADATSFAKKHQASLLWGIKPSCADLQLINLASAPRDSMRRRAYLSVGERAVVDELLFHGPGWRSWAVDGCTGMRRIPTPWRLCRKPREQYLEVVDEGDEDDGKEKDGGDVPTEELTAEAMLEKAEAATVVEEQQRAYVEGGRLHSTTTTTGDEVVIPLPPGLEGGLASGDRTAQARFPLVSEKQNYLHSNNPPNLQQAHDKRNIGIGNHNPLVSEARTRDLLVEQLKTKLFTRKNLKEAMSGFESVRRTALPKKLTHEAAMKVELEAMNACLREDQVGFDTVVKAFVKSEVTGKDKPRPIANHGETRLYALSKVAYAFEHVMFSKLIRASIKERPKKEAIAEILQNMDGMREGAYVENDLTAFEFGISEPLKQIEQEILRHIANIIGVEDSGQLLFDRVVDDRDKSVTWKMKYRDATGETKTAKVKIEQTMRESGDRITSSGNFLQNLIAWFSFLVDPEHVEDAFDTLLKSRGARMFYVSARDQTLVDVRGRKVRRKYLVCFAFEGDDTLGRLEEKLWPKSEDEPCQVMAFFDRWGWKAKLVWKPLVGDAYVRFVGYEALISDNKVVYDGAELVMTPETKRFLNTKAWTSTCVTPQELKTCIRIFAATLAEGFKRVEPMHAFLQAMFDDNSGGVDVAGEKVREYFLSAHGVLPDASTVMKANVRLPEFEGGDASKWKRLLRASAGDFSDAEWATMCHIGTMQQHGADLATSVPAAWRA
jgi:hypothetical protein